MRTKVKVYTLTFLEERMGEITNELKRKVDIMKGLDRQIYLFGMIKFKTYLGKLKMLNSPLFTFGITFSMLIPLQG